jgi:hypothetical protein
MSEGMSGRQFREEKARLEAQQAQQPGGEAHREEERGRPTLYPSPGATEIRISRKEAFQFGIWAASGATVWFAIILPIIVFVLTALGFSLM